jgi:hypothetical protein
MSWVKFSAGIICFIVAFAIYRDVKGKKMLRIGDNQLFNENSNRVSPVEYVRSWSLVLMSLLCGIIFIIYSFE